MRALGQTRKYTAKSKGMTKDAVLQNKNSLVFIFFCILWLSLLASCNDVETAI
jgi:hypothetical protein